MGYLDERQRLFVVDRKKDMIITGGENVYSVEVENLLSTHPAVREVAVIGVPDEQWNEAVKAIVVFMMVRAHRSRTSSNSAADGLPDTRFPKSVDFSSEELPKTGPGKIAKRQLRDPYWAGRQRVI